MENFVWEKKYADHCTSEPPKSREGLSICHSKQYGILLFGGVNENQYNDLWQFNLEKNAWKLLETSGNKPCARCYQVIFFDNPYLFVFGGINDTQTTLNDFWILDLEHLKWKRIFQLDPPLSRSCHAVCNGEFEKNKFIYGGYNSQKNKVLDDLWLVDYQNLVFNRGLIEIPGQKWDLQRTCGKHPGPKYGHTLCMYDGKLYLFGGKDTMEATSENSDKQGKFSVFVQCFDTYEWTEAVLEEFGFPLRYNFSCNRISDNQFFVHGGKDYSGDNVVESCLIVDIEKQCIEEILNEIDFDFDPNMPRYCHGHASCTIEKIQRATGISKSMISNPNSTRSLKANPLNTADIKKVIIIGGKMSTEYYCDMNVYILEFKETSKLAILSDASIFQGKNRSIEHKQLGELFQGAASPKEEQLFNIGFNNSIEKSEKEFEDSDVVLVNKDHLIKECKSDHGVMDSNQNHLGDNVIPEKKVKNFMSTIGFDHRLSFCNNNSLRESNNNALRDNVFHQNASASHHDLFDYKHSRDFIDYKDNYNKKGETLHKRLHSDIVNSNTKLKMNSQDLDQIFENNTNPANQQNSPDVNELISQQFHKKKPEKNQTNKFDHYPEDHKEISRDGSNGKYLQNQPKDLEAERQQRDIKNLERRKKNYQDSFGMKLNDQKELIKKLDEENDRHIELVESCLMLTKQEDMYRNVYDEKAWMLENNFQSLQVYLLNLDRFIMSLKDVDMGRNFYKKREMNNQLKSNKDDIMKNRDGYTNGQKELKYYYEMSCGFIEDTDAEVKEMDGLFRRTFPEYKKLLDDSEIIDEGYADREGFY